MKSESSMVIKNVCICKIFILNVIHLGWKVVDFSSISKAIHKQVKRYEGSVKLLLKEFFFYYSNFAFQTDVSELANIFFDAKIQQF